MKELEAELELRDVDDGQRELARRLVQENRFLRQEVALLRARAEDFSKNPLLPERLQGENTGLNSVTNRPEAHMDSQQELLRANEIARRKLVAMNARLRQLQGVLKGVEQEQVDQTARKEKIRLLETKIRMMQIQWGDSQEIIATWKEQAVRLQQEMDVASRLRDETEQALASATEENDGCQHNLALLRQEIEEAQKAAEEFRTVTFQLKEAAAARIKEVAGLEEDLDVAQENRVALERRLAVAKQNLFKMAAESTAGHEGNPPNAERDPESEL